MQFYFFNDFTGQKIMPQDVVVKLLKQREIVNIDEFLSPTHPINLKLEDFGYGSGQLNHVVNLLDKAKQEKRKIIVYTDYDADGITGGAVLWDTLYQLGFDAMPYVPHRAHEGYGFSIKGLDYIKKTYDPALIFSVDHGITAVEQIKYAQSFGMKVIVTDHHLTDVVLPEAEGIYHIPALSGSGVAYLVAKSLVEHYLSSDDKMYAHFRQDYLAIATIGIVADLVPLIGPARQIVTHGLQAFTKLTKPGLQSLVQVSRLQDREITPYEIGFQIAPRINAVGRLEHALDALRLLCTRDQNKAMQIAQSLDVTNIERQHILEKSINEAIAIVEARLDRDGNLPKIIILVSETWLEGIIGLIASKITQRYYRPSLVLTRSEGNYKASARSVSSVHITNLIRQASDLLLSVGGHSQAGGFSLLESNLEAFKNRMLTLAEEQISDADIVEKIEIDAKINLSQLSLELVQAIERLKPFGVGNPNPTFYSQGRVQDFRFIGKTQQHLRLQVVDLNTSTQSVEMICFNMGDKVRQIKLGGRVELVYTLGINCWQGECKLQGRVEQLNLI